jgi:hypothetical protein
MRDIELRGKTNSKKWIFGSLVYSPEIQPAIYFPEKHSSNGFDWAYVEPETVGQYTGFSACKSHRGTDKQALKVFESDILKDLMRGNTLKAYWSESWYAFMVEYVNIGGLGKLSDYFTDRIEIIGNIHDTPKLLEKL